MKWLWHKYIRWYQRLWLRVCFPGIDLSRDDLQLIAACSCRRIATSRWFPAFLMIVCILTMVLSSVVVWFLGNGSFWMVPVWLALLFPIAAALNIILMWPMRRICRRTVRSAVIELGGDVCAKCGYLLLEQRRCPECGATR